LGGRGSGYVIQGGCSSLQQTGGQILAHDRMEAGRQPGSTAGMGDGYSMREV